MLHVLAPGTETFFLWGPRLAGKSTLLRETYPENGPGIDFVRLLNQGCLPSLYTAKKSRARALLEAYIFQYIKEEITAEGLASSLPKTARRVLVSLDEHNRTTEDDIELLHWRRFLERLWSGAFF